MKRIVVLTQGFVYVGNATIGDRLIKITDAQCIRRWGTNNGLAQLATEGVRPQTELEPKITVTAPLTSLVHVIECTHPSWA